MDLALRRSPVSFTASVRRSEEAEIRVSVAAEGERMMTRRPRLSRRRRHEDGGVFTLTVTMSKNESIISLPRRGSSDRILVETPLGINLLVKRSVVVVATFGFIYCHHHALFYSNALLVSSLVVVAECIGFL